MDRVPIVRHKVLVEGRSQRAVARELGLARVTVRKYLDQAVPVYRAEAAPRPRPVWDAVAERMQALLAESVRWTGGEQREGCRIRIQACGLGDAVESLEMTRSRPCRLQTVSKTTVDSRALGSTGEN